MMGFAEVLNPSYALAAHRRRQADAVFVPAIASKLARGANQQIRVQPLRQKYSPFTSDPNHLHKSCRLVPPEGRLAIVTDAGRDAVDAGDVKRRMTWLADGEAVWS
jgi:hypothetical protein